MQAKGSVRLFRIPRIRAFVICRNAFLSIMSVSAATNDFWTAVPCRPLPCETPNLSSPLLLADRGSVLIRISGEESKRAAINTHYTLPNTEPNPLPCAQMLC